MASLVQLTPDGKKAIDFVRYVSWCGSGQEVICSLRVFNSPMIQSATPAVSIVVPTLNEAENIYPLLTRIF
ncbi:MAG: hypothetical protein P4L42_05670, partial [Desulfocapsaceae bacterium]|nr:hypothetical protein [Desulfocapsaceae bacterium]